MQHRRDELPRFTEEDEETASYVMDYYTNRKIVAICRDIPYEFPYIESEHSRLLGLMKLAQLDTPDAVFTIDASLEENRVTSSDTTGFYQFGARGFCGDIPYTIVLNPDTSFTLRYASVDRKGFLEQESPDSYELDSVYDDVSYAELSVFFYSLLAAHTQKENGIMLSPAAISELLDSVKRADFTLLGTMIEEIGGAYGITSEQFAKETIYSDSLDRSIYLGVQNTEYGDCTERRLTKRASYFPEHALGSLAGRLAMEQEVTQINIPTREVDSTFKTSLAIDSNPPQFLRSKAVLATIEALTFLATNTAIEEQL